MRTLVPCSILLGMLWVFPGCSGVETGDSQAGEVETADGPGLAGSYHLVKRQLPDGSVLEPPSVFGFMTYTDGYRHFHLRVPRADGEPSAISFVSSYIVSGGSYTEMPLYVLRHDQTEGAGVTYEIPGERFTVPLTRTDRAVQFEDGESGVLLEITRDSMIATSDSVFVDHWARLE